MTRVAAAVAIVLLHVLEPARAVVAQPPDFSGTWVEDTSQRKSDYDTAAAPGARMMVAPEVDTVVTQTPATITIDRRSVTLVRFVYDLGGKESVNHNGANTKTTRSRWEGQKLVTEGTSYSVTSLGESNWKIKEVRWLTPNMEMAAESTTIDEDGIAKRVLQVFRRK